MRILQVIVCRQRERCEALSFRPLLEEYRPPPPPPPPPPQDHGSVQTSVGQWEC
jgi:hypothetical protein